MTTTLHLYHTNDLHSYFSNWPQTINYLKRMKERHQRAGEEALFLDIGDHMDRSNPITEGSMGRANVTLLNELPYDYITIGNNEGITFTKEMLSTVYTEGSFQVVLANLFNRDDSRPDWLIPYTIHRLSSGLRVGITGMTAPFQDFYEPLGWKVEEPLLLLPAMIKELRNKADIVILMSHLGLKADERIAERIMGIDAILGAHTHHVLKEGLHIGDTLIGQAGKFGRYIGKTTITYNPDKQRVIKKKMEAIEIPSVKDQKAFELLKTLSEDSSKQLQEVVTELKAPLSISWEEESPFAILLAKAIREWCNADLSMINSGLLLASLNKGTVTKGHLHEICPHPINPCRVTIKGEDIETTIQRALSDEFKYFQLKGFGFRGVILGMMVFDHLTYEIESINGDIKVNNIKVAGKRIERNKDYSVGTLDMFTFGNLLPKIKEAKDKHFYLPEMLRDVLAWKLSK